MINTDFESRYPVAYKIHLKCFYFISFLYLIISSGLYINHRFNIAKSIHDEIEINANKINNNSSVKESNATESFLNKMKKIKNSIYIGTFSYYDYTYNNNFNTNICIKKSDNIFMKLFLSKTKLKECKMYKKLSYSGVVDIKVTQKEISKNVIYYILLISLFTDKKTDIIIPVIFKNYENAELNRNNKSRCTSCWNINHEIRETNYNVSKSEDKSMNYNKKGNSKNRNDRYLYYNNDNTNDYISLLSYSKIQLYKKNNKRRESFSNNFFQNFRTFSIYKCFFLNAIKRKCFINENLDTNSLYKINSFMQVKYFNLFSVDISKQHYNNISFIINESALNIGINFNTSKETDIKDKEDRENSHHSHNTYSNNFPHFSFLSISTNKILYNQNEELVKSTKQPMFIILAIISSLNAFISFCSNTYTLIKLQSNKKSAKYFSKTYIIANLLFNALSGFTNILICINKLSIKFNVVFYPGLIILNLFSLLEFRVLISIMILTKTKQYNKILCVVYIMYALIIFFCQHLVLFVMDNFYFFSIIAFIMFSIQIIHNILIGKKSRLHTCYTITQSVNLMQMPIFCSYPFFENSYLTIYGSFSFYSFVFITIILNIVLLYQSWYSPRKYLPKYINRFLFKPINYIVKEFHTLIDFCCSICLENTNVDIIIETRCGHYFHYSCLRKWMTYIRKCPYCKNILPKLI